MKLQEGSGERVGPRGLARRLGGAVDPRFSICTMLTDWSEYRECIASFVARGFDEDTCEFIAIDNSAGNQADGFVATNEFLQAARGRIVILAHQDLLLIEHGRADLEARLAELDAVDPNWAVCGNAGYTDDGWPVLNLEQSYGPELQRGELPTRVMSLDENFLVVRREANLAVSRDLHGYHHYGPDLCIVADILGWNAYVIDFYLKHKSTGTIDERYTGSRDRIAAKYARALRPRWMFVVTQYHFPLSPKPAHHRFTRAFRLWNKLLGRHPRGFQVMDPEHRARAYARKRLPRP